MFFESESECSANFSSCHEAAGAVKYCKCSVAKNGPQHTYIVELEIVELEIV